MAEARAKDYATVDVSKLTLDPSNARLHPEKNMEAIKGSLLKFGQQKPIVVTRKNVVIAGNGTLEAARSLGWTKLQVKYTDLSGPEAIAYALADNRSSELAEWDTGILGYQLQSLYEDGFAIADIGFDPSNYLADIVPNENLGESMREDYQERVPELDPITDEPNWKAHNYTRKIQAPIYTPTGEKPELSELVNLDRMNKLLAEIKASALSGDVKEFLSLSAARHAVFNFQKIAEYYAHAKPEQQALMEASALVVIDFEKAIENGYIQITRDLTDVYSKEATDDEND